LHARGQHPTDRTTNCPTIRFYGINLGTDKIGHIFQQGYEYFTRYADARDRGADEASALAGDVKYGVVTELGLYGVTLTGVYSNGDLAGNYAGFRFYRNLFHEVRTGDRTFAPMLRRDGTHWVIDPGRDNPELLKPFISEHLTEAYDPSRYVFSVDRIRSQVRDRCKSWFGQVPGFEEDGYRAQLERVRTWFGEPYGWNLPDETAVTLLECFGGAVDGHGVEPVRGSGGATPAGTLYRLYDHRYCAGHLRIICSSPRLS
jgi:hypothetical protein